MKIFVSALLLSFALSAAPAYALIVAGDDAAYYQWWGDKALVPAPDVTVTTSRAWCPSQVGYVACTRVEDDGSILVFMGPIIWRSREAWLHELGHVYDYMVMGRGDLTPDGRARSTHPRRRFLHLSLRGRIAWRTDLGDSPHERFAEAWGICASNSMLKGRKVNGGYGYQVTTERHARICAFLQRLDSKP